MQVIGNTDNQLTVGSFTAKTSHLVLKQVTLGFGETIFEPAFVFTLYCVKNDLSVMIGNRKFSTSSRKRLVWRAMTVLLFFYICADVTVLEYFCGNPELGIVSYTQVVKKISTKAGTSQTGWFKSSTDSPKQNDEPEIPFDGDDCFCCSSHAVITYNRLVVSLAPVVIRYQAPNFSNRQNHSDWHLPPFYRPPRLS